MSGSRASGRIGCMPGSFNPLTVAHVSVADAARRTLGLARVDLVLSRRTLAKEHLHQPPAEVRAAAAREATAHLGWLGVTVTDAQLLVDIAAGYDVLVIGADKWAQLHDPRFYGDDPAARDAAVARLPTVAVAPRPPHPLPAPGDGIVILEVDPGLAAVSSTAVRAGALHWRAVRPLRPPASSGPGGGDRA